MQINVDGFYYQIVVLGGSLVYNCVDTFLNDEGLSNMTVVIELDYVKP